MLSKLLVLIKGTVVMVLVGDVDTNGIQTRNDRV